MVVHICYIEYTYKMAMSDPWENPNYKEALGYSEKIMDIEDELEGCKA